MNQTTNDNGLFVGLGYLFDFPGRGVFSPDDKVEVTPEQAEKHNAILSQAEIDGLDNCQIGQWGTFYYVNNQVRTWVGQVVSDTIWRNGNGIKFEYKDKMFRGRLQKNADYFNFKRIS